jgi:hypothetical protein
MQDLRFAVGGWLRRTGCCHVGLRSGREGIEYFNARLARAPPVTAVSGPMIVVDYLVPRQLLRHSALARLRDTINPSDDSEESSALPEPHEWGGKSGAEAKSRLNDCQSKRNTLK